MSNGLLGSAQVRTTFVSSHKMMPSKANPKLLPDVPHLDDRLGGAHKQLAESITKLILTSDGGKSIKLDGFWGSGKSTVVGMLTKCNSTSGGILDLSISIRRVGACRRPASTRLHDFIADEVVGCEVD
jgi:ABC-type transport system involved in cytochrome bd biosynthesis fused ATPase/permease subunit